MYIKKYEEMHSSAQEILHTQKKRFHSTARQKKIQFKFFLFLCVTRESRYCKYMQYHDSEMCCSLNINLFSLALSFIIVD